MKTLLAFTAIAEAATGVALVIAPSLVAQLVFDAELAGAAVAVGRMAGIALFSLGVACWPAGASASAALRGMTCYNLLAAVYLLQLGIGGEAVGALLWAGAAFHVTMTAFLLKAWRAPRDGHTA